MFSFVDAKGAFSLFDKKDTGVLPIKDLGQVFRSCAMTVDSEQLSDWLGEMGVEGIRPVILLFTKTA